MFAKLLKHEIKSTAGLLGILSPAALAVGIIGGFVMRGVMNPPATAQGTEEVSLLAGMLLPFVFLSLFAYAFGGEIYLAVQFYKRKFTDQGYLTFTLPVRSWQIYLSSLLNMLLWTLVIGTVTIVSFLAVIFIAMYDTEAWHMMMDSVSQFPVEMQPVFGEFGIWSVLNPIIAFVSGNVLLITSITMGCVLAKKHKILVSIGCYYVISMVLSTVSTIFSTISMFRSVEIQLDQIFMASSLQNLFVILAGSVLSVWLMDKKLNLP